MAFVASVAYPFYESVVRGRRTMQYRRECDATQWWDADRLRHHQVLELQRLLRHCNEHVPFYRDQWTAADFDWRGVDAIEQIAGLPILTKRDVREHFGRLLADADLEQVFSKTTGGSTGEPLRLEYDRASFERRTAVAARGYGWASCPPGTKRLDFWGVDFESTASNSVKRALFDHFVLRRRVVNSWQLGEDRADQVVRLINSYRPESIVGFTGALEVVSKWIAARGGLSHSPRSVLTAAEKLEPGQRGQIEAAFGARAFETYGCREFMLIGAECEAHQGLHLSDDHLIVEIVDEEGRPVRETSGRIVVTDLHNYRMPFIRYDTGDIGGPILAERCACGRGLRRLVRVEGRMLDVLRSVAGAAVPGEFFPHLLKDVDSIAAYQVRQTAPDCLRLLVVFSTSLSERDEQQIRSNVAKAFGEGMSLQIEPVATIPLTRGGKRRVTAYEVA